jgi:hypothetical protein
VFPCAPEIPDKPDWRWFVEDWDLGDPSGCYFASEAEALADARARIEEAQS